MNAAYFDQFNINNIIYLQISENITVISNFFITTILTIILIQVFFHTHNLIPNHLNLLIETIYNIINNVCVDHLEQNSNNFNSFLFTLFIFLIITNLLGILPYVFTSTTHIIITFTLSISIIISTTIIGFNNWNIDFLSTLTPQSAPIILTPLLILIETTSYLTRIISLSVRLAANISAGHLLFSIISSFILETIISHNYIISFIPITLLFFITLLEFTVAIIQAYVFTLLTTIYISDVINLH